jgi:disulfide bond formation protein DsbB
MTVEEMMTAIQAAPAVSCGDIPFELFGISMAGYNVLLCLGLGVYCLIASYTVVNHKRAAH